MPMAVGLELAPGPALVVVVDRPRSPMSASVSRGASGAGGGARDADGAVTRRSLPAEKRSASTTPEAFVGKVGARRIRLSKLIA